jgi:hypothetical protein
MKPLFGLSSCRPQTFMTPKYSNNKPSGTAD